MRWYFECLLLSMTLWACASAQIPYDLDAIKKGEAPVHPVRVAVLPLVDGRTVADGSDKAGRFVYRGIEYAATDLGRLPGDPMLRVTEVLAKHLAKRRSFAQMIMVLSEGQAPEADLLLSGKVFRMRGYVEATAPDKKSGRPENERFVLSEVVLKDLKLTDLKSKRVLMDVDIGWSLFDKTKVINDVEPDPWRVMAKALQVALTRYSDELAKADLSGAYQVKAKVGLLAKTATTSDFGVLEESPPTGWRFVGTNSASAPVGWRGKAGCKKVTLSQQQTLRFHRVLGPYKPTVKLWRCPPELSLKFNGLEEFPARYMGVHADGAHYFMHGVGESNWPEAFEEVQTHLGLKRPESKYVFEVGPHGVRAAKRSRR